MMFMGGDPKDKPTEFTPRSSMVECLKVKRKIKRTQGPGGPRWVCQKGKLELEIKNGPYFGPDKDRTRVSIRND